MCTLGRRIALLRKSKCYVQEDLAKKLGVSAQAVSKWENDISCPDITLLPTLAHILGVSTDWLLTGSGKDVTFLPKNRRKPLDQLTLQIYVNCSNGNKIRVNLPMPLIKACIESGQDITAGMNFAQRKQEMDIFNKIDFYKITELAVRGLIGKIVEMESPDGDTTEIIIA